VATEAQPLVAVADTADRMHELVAINVAFEP
jgi:hypothetical protein